MYRVKSLIIQLERKMTKLGYARVSSTSQSTNIQVEALKAAGCSTVRTEKVSGKSRDGRDELATILIFYAKAIFLLFINWTVLAAQYAML